MSALLLQTIFGGLTAGSIYAMIALGFTLVYRATTVINFAHGEFVSSARQSSAWCRSASW